MALFKISQGPSNTLNNQSLTEGYCWFTPDDGKFYIDAKKNNVLTRIPLNAAVADSANSVAWTNVSEKPGNSSSSATGFMTSDQYTKLDGIATGAQVNVLESITASGTAPLTLTASSVSNKSITISGSIADASTSAKGVVKIGDGISVNNGTISVTASSLGLSSAMLFKGSLGTGGTITSLPAAAVGNSGYTYKVITAGTYASQVAKVGDVFVSDGSSWILIPSGDEPSGTVTSITLKAGSGISLDTDNSAITTSGTRTISHADTSSQVSVTANGRKYITGVTLDTYGHVTGLTTGTETVTDTTYSAGTGLSLSGTTFKVQNVPEAELTWGGKNFSASYGPIDAAMIDLLGANRFAFLKPAGLTIEYSTDDGSNWTDYGATDAQKTGLFGIGQSFVLGKHSTVGTNTINDQLRVTIATSAARVYTILNKIAIYMSTAGNIVQVKIEKALESTPTSFSTHLDWTNISGWSGWNILNISGITTYGNSAASQYGRIRFVFRQTAVRTNSSSASISRIMGFGGVGWTVPSNMAHDGHLYSYDNAQNAVFPGSITATAFIGPLSGNATTATTATNLSAAPSLTASGNNITITAGGKTSSAFTVPYATSAGSATKATQDASGNTITTYYQKKITSGTTDPTGGSDGDIYFQYEE